MAAPANIPRGVRNNNPLNLEYNPAFQGLKATRTDDRFCEFTTMARGWRAAAVTLVGYQDRYGITTIKDTIARWAPAVENDVNAYVNDVCARSHFDATEKIDYHNFNDTAPIMLAMAVHENGPYPFKQADIVAGCQQAGLENVPRGVVGSVVKTSAPVVTGVAGWCAENTDVLTAKFQWLQPLVAAGPHYLRYGFWGIVVLIATAVGIGEVRKLQRSK